MNSRPSFDDLLSDWLEDGPADAPSPILETVAAAIPSIPQRRVLVRVPWRFPIMNTYAKLAAAAVAVIAVGAIGLAILRPGASQVGGPAPSPSPSPGPSSPAAPSPIAIPPLSEVFTSPIHGYSVGHPAGWRARAATEPWRALSVVPYDAPYADVLGPDPQSAEYLTIASVALAQGTTVEAWIEEYLAFARFKPCGTPLATEPVTIDGVVGVLDVHCAADHYEAVVVSRGRGYVINLTQIPADLKWFRQILATVRLHPENAVDAAPSVAPSASP